MIVMTKPMASPRRRGGGRAIFRRSMLALDREGRLDGGRATRQILVDSVIREFCVGRGENAWRGVSRYPAIAGSVS
jgi:hypothetical protein